MEKPFTILVPVDFSPVAKNALEHAIALAQAVDAKLILLHVYYIPGMSARVQYIAGNAASPEQCKEAEQKMEAFKEEVPLLQSVSCETRVIPAYWPIELPGIIQEQEANLIMMGTKGATGLKEITVGTVTSTVTDSSANPVWVIPSPALPVAIKNIGFVLDQEMIENTAILDPLLSIAGKLEATIHIFCIKPGAGDPNCTAAQERNMTTMKHYLGRSHSTHSYISSDDIQADINRYMEDKDIQLIAMVARKQSLLQSLLNSKPVKMLTYRGTAALLVLPGKV